MNGLKTTVAILSFAPFCVFSQIQTEGDQGQQSVDAKYEAVLRTHNEKIKADAIAQKERELQAKECAATNDYQLYEAESEIVMTKRNISWTQARIAEEREIANASGVRNLTADYNNASNIIYLKRHLKESFAEYKRLGGKAASPQVISDTSSADPCTGAAGRHTLPSNDPRLPTKIQYPIPATVDH